MDLKQKQSNVLDSRSTRIQADESLKLTQKMAEMTQTLVEMNIENRKQGETLMVFTIVTIIFVGNPASDEDMPDNLTFISAAHVFHGCFLLDQP